jgi:hypothetical protein
MGDAALATMLRNGFGGREVQGDPVKRVAPPRVDDCTAAGGGNGDGGGWEGFCQALDVARPMRIGLRCRCEDGVESRSSPPFPEFTFLRKGFHESPPQVPRR